MCNTYDVLFYASNALASLFPKLQLTIQYDIRDAVTSENETMTWFLYSGRRGYRKRKNTVPHDIGDPSKFTLYKNLKPQHIISYLFH